MVGQQLTQQQRSSGLQLTIGQGGVSGAARRAARGVLAVCEQRAKQCSSRQRKQRAQRGGIAWAVHRQRSRSDRGQRGRAATLVKQRALVARRKGVR
ncbi:unnamed protein product [Closterium sp. NIES-64]|nr:unnamed protein product [Closterium sp. NIES-64]